MHTKVVLLLVSISLLVTPSVCTGQTIEYNRTKSANEIQELARRHQKNNANISPITVAPALPGLPSYTGSTKFVNGYVQPTEKGYVVYQVSLLAKEQPDQVRQWYQDAFNAWKWKITCAGDQVITAQNEDDNLCTITFNPAASGQGYATALRIHYNQAPPK